MKESIKRKVQIGTDPKIAGIIRHVLNFIGTILMALGYFKGFDMATFTDIVLAFVGAGINVYVFLASYFAKEKEPVIPDHIPTEYPN